MILNGTENFFYFNNAENDTLVRACSCDMQALASSNVTGKIVLCYAPGEAQVALIDAIRLSVEAGANGVIFAQNAANNLDNLGACGDSMPCVLVDFEIAQRITSYWKRTR
jgi:hypothetical protein